MHAVPLGRVVPRVSPFHVPRVPLVVLRARRPLPGSEYGHQPVTQWSLQRGYSAGPLESAYPTRAIKGSIGGLGILLLAPIRDVDYVCRGPTQGFKVLWCPLSSGAAH